MDDSYRPLSEEVSSTQITTPKTSILGSVLRRFDKPIRISYLISYRKCRIRKITPAPVSCLSRYFTEGIV